MRHMRMLTMTKSPIQLSRNCGNCNHWKSVDGPEGDCEHPEIRNKVVCIAVPCYNNPDPSWAGSVGYRTVQEFGCNLFQPYEYTGQSMAVGPKNVMVRVQPGEERFRENLTLYLDQLHDANVIATIAIEEADSDRSRQAIAWANTHSVPWRISNEISEDVLLL